MGYSTEHLITDPQEREKHISKMQTMYPEFYSLIRVGRVNKKNRKCLRCGVVFMSAGAHNRRCAQCLNIKTGVLGTYTVDLREAREAQ